MHGKVIGGNTGGLSLSY